MAALGVVFVVTCLTAFAEKLPVFVCYQYCMSNGIVLFT